LVCNPATHRCERLAADAQREARADAAPGFDRAPARDHEAELARHDAPRADGPGPDLASQAWQQVPSSTTVALGEVHGSSATDVWAVGGAILHFDGQAWKKNDPRAASGVWAISPTEAWAVEGQTRLRYNGTGWAVFDTTPGAMWLDLWGTGGSLWSVGLSGTLKGLLAYFDGTTWSQLERPDFLESLSGSAASNVWAVGQTAAGGGAAYRFDGATWTSVPPGGQSLHGLWAFSANDVWAVGKQQILHYVGSAWKNATPPGLGKGWLVDLWGAGGSLWAVGYSDRDTVANTFGSGIVYHYNGTSWSPVVSPAITASTPALFAIWGASATDIWAVGQGGTILRYH
jgi:hypothetical protein